MIGNAFEYLANASLGLYWLKGQNFVSVFVNINVCPPPVFGKMFTKSTDKNRVGPPPPHHMPNTLYADFSCNSAYGVFGIYCIFTPYAEWPILLTK